MSINDVNYITLGTVKKMGFTPTMIKEYLGGCDKEVCNPHYKSATPMQLFDRDRVEAIARREDVAVLLKIQLKKRQTAKVKRQQHKAAKVQLMELQIDNLRPELSVGEAELLIKVGVESGVIHHHLLRLRDIVSRFLVEQIYYGYYIELCDQFKLEVPSHLEAKIESKCSNYVNNSIELQKFIVNLCKNKQIEYQEELKLARQREEQRKLQKLLFAGERDEFRQYVYDNRAKFISTAIAIAGLVDPSIYPSKNQRKNANKKNLNKLGLALIRVAAMAWNDEPNKPFKIQQHHHEAVYSDINHDWLPSFLLNTLQQIKHQLSTINSVD